MIGRRVRGRRSQEPRTYTPPESRSHRGPARAVRTVLRVHFRKSDGTRQAGHLAQPGSKRFVDCHTASEMPAHRSRLGGSLDRFVPPSSCVAVIAKIIRPERTRSPHGRIRDPDNSSKESQAKLRMRCIRLAVTVASGARGVGWMSPVRTVRRARSHTLRDTEHSVRRARGVTA